MAFEKSAVAEHAWQDEHCINWEDAENLDTAKDLKERKTKEALYIKLTPPGCRINRDEGRDLPPLWLRTVKKLKRKDTTPPMPRPHRPRPHQTLHLELAGCSSSHTHQKRHHPRLEDLRHASDIGLCGVGVGDNPGRGLRHAH